MTVTVTLVENQALVVMHPTSRATASLVLDPMSSQRLPVARGHQAGTPPPGWYLTGNIGIRRGSSTLRDDSRLERDAGLVPENGGPGRDQRHACCRNSIAWTSNPGPGFGTDPGRAFSVYDLGTQETRRLTTSDPATRFPRAPPARKRPSADAREPVAGGDGFAPAWIRPEPDDRRLPDRGGERRGRTRLEVAGERPHRRQRIASSVPGHSQPPAAYDIYHCNSIDQDPLTGDLLLSPHNADAVYRINRSTGAIVWKLGGNSIVGDRERHLTVRNDPERPSTPSTTLAFSRATTSRSSTTTPGTSARRAASSTTSTRAPDGDARMAIPVTRRRAQRRDRRLPPICEGNDNLITWGIQPNSLFTEVDAAGNVLRTSGFPTGMPRTGRSRRR